MDFAGDTVASGHFPGACGLAIIPRSLSLDHGVFKAADAMRDAGMVAEALQRG